MDAWEAFAAPWAEEQVAGFVSEVVVQQEGFEVALEAQEVEAVVVVAAVVVEGTGDAQSWPLVVDRHEEDFALSQALPKSCSRNLEPSSCAPVRGERDQHSYSVECEPYRSAVSCTALGVRVQNAARVSREILVRCDAETYPLQW